MNQVTAMWYGYLADVIVAVHVAYMAFIIFGQFAIMLGRLRHWRWAQNAWFRLLHVLAIVVVAVEAIFGIPCPLTTWEADLRERAGQAVTGETFVGRLLHKILFYDLPPWVFTTCYIAFALLVIVTLLWAPPRWRRSSPHLAAS